MFKVGIKRTEKETVIRVKTDVPGEKAFKFESLSPTISQKHLKVILPMMIATERSKRIKKAHRKVELKAERERKAALAEKFARSEDIGTQIDEKSEV